MRTCVDVIGGRVLRVRAGSYKYGMREGKKEPCEDELGLEVLV